MDKLNKLEKINRFILTEGEIKNESSSEIYIITNYTSQ